jgi:putative FmdB family regulatory protein
MPTYVYECSNCNSTFEADQRIVEDPLDTCVPCGSTGTVKRLIQPIAVMFKGSGFYVNDSAKVPPTPEKPAEAVATTETVKTEPAAPAVAPSTEATETK